MTMARLAAIAIVLVGAVAAAAASPGPAAATRPATVSSAAYSHVVVVIDENYSGPAVVGGGQAPYVKGLAAQGEYFAAYHGVTHPSEGNYMAILTGSTQGTDGSDSCIKSSARSLVGEARSAGVSVRGYIEGLSSGRNYACRHDPFSQLADARSAETDFTGFPASFTRLPQLSVVVPNTTDDMGDTGTIASGDRWARAHLNSYAQWAKTHNSLLILVSDENAADPNYSRNQPGERGNGALAIAVGARIRAGRVVTQNFDHYSMLRTLEDIFGLRALGASAHAADMLP